MIINIYLSQGQYLKSRVDEGTSHQLGESVDIDGQEYMVIEVKTEEHYDYQSIVRVNNLIQTPPKELAEAMY